MKWQGWPYPLFFERMYKTLEFSIAVLVAVIGINIGFLQKNYQTEAITIFVFCMHYQHACISRDTLCVQRIFPISMQPRNRNANKTLYCNIKFDTPEFSKIMRQYVKTNNLLISSPCFPFFRTFSMLQWRHQMTR